MGSDNEAPWVWGSTYPRNVNLATYLFSMRSHQLTGYANQLKYV